MPQTANLIYEWDLEEWGLDEMGEPYIHDHNHAETFAEVVEMRDRFERHALHAQSGLSFRIVLVRDDTRMTGFRSWAYLTNGVLPEFFAEPGPDGEYRSNGIKVPQRFHREVLKVGAPA